MNQKEYNAKMAELNNQMHAELLPLKKELERVGKEKAIINQQTNLLRAKSN